MALPSASIFPLDHAIFKHYMELDVKEIQAEYVWIGGSGSDLRSKTRTVTDLKEVHSPEQLPIWNYDGSSTGQAPGRDSEVYLKPAAVYRDPFRRGKHVLVLCESVLPDGKETPIPTNTRNHAAKIMERAAAQEPWFGVEQEFTLFQPDGVTPLGWPHGGYPGPQGPYYCSAGAEVSFGRRIVEAHYRACLYAGLKIAGCNAEVMAGQWEYQVGPCLGIECGDQVTMARYIMQRVCEDFGCLVSFHPKPKAGDWNGAGCHTNFSTKAMREEGGFEVILSAIKKLGAKHDDHIAVYGKDNEKRLTGAHETAPIDKFSYGVANRGASIRIPRQSKLQGKGYFEDRRPASNMDPYVVSAKIVQTVCLDE